jgi:hypothetical protein
MVAIGQITLANTDDAPFVAVVMQIKELHRTISPSRVSGSSCTKPYGSTADMLAFQVLTARKSLW